MNVTRCPPTQPAIAPAGSARPATTGRGVSEIEGDPSTIPTCFRPGGQTRLWVDGRGGHGGAQALEILAALCVVGPEAQRLLVMPLSLVRPPELQQGAPQIVVGLGGVGIDAQRLFVMRDSLPS
jgi:hypothetical protein